MLNEWGRMPILHESRWEWGMMRCVGRNLREMVLVVFNLNTDHRYRGVGSPVCERVWSVLLARVERVVREGFLNRHSFNSVIASVALLALSACNGCATPQPLGISCRAVSTGQVMSRGMSEGPTSVGESRGMQQSRFVCSIIYSSEEFEAEMGSNEQ